MMGVIYAVGRAINKSVSFLVFTLLDLLDMFLCGMYKLADFIMEAEWKPCYCSSSFSSSCSSLSGARKAITTMISSTRDNKILVSEKGNINGGTKIVRFISSSSRNKILQLEDMSDTLYTRPSLVSEISKTGSKVNELFMKRVEFSKSFLSSSLSSSSNSSSEEKTRSLKKMGGSGGGRGGQRNNSKTGFTKTASLNSTSVEMLKWKIKNGGSQLVQQSCSPRWSDCDCETCTCWTTSSSSSSSNSTSMPSLYLHLDGASAPTSFSGDNDVLFIHGFISSSKFWTETVFPDLSAWTKSKYRLFAVDLLGFGRSPKPTDSLYTLREHVEMIERSVLEKHKVKSFHIVAHSLGCILAFALAVRHPSKIKSLTLIAPPYFPVPQGEQGTQYVLRRVAPRRVWPPIAFGASIACWYEHISRTICLLICKNHRLWEFLFRLLTRNRMKTYLMEGFFCHTHNAAWHTLHNIICGTAGKVDKYLDVIRERLTCHVTIFHGRDDEVIPEECSYNVKSKIPRAQIKVIDNKDHITVVVGRQKAFARELEAIWNSSS